MSEIEPGTIQDLLAELVACAGVFDVSTNYEADKVSLEKATQAVLDHVQTLRDERDRLARAIVWALGYTDFRAREQGEGAYWWRTELRLRAKLTGEQIDAILAALTPAGGGQDDRITKV